MMRQDKHLALVPFRNHDGGHICIILIRLGVEVPPKHLGYPGITPGNIEVRLKRQPRRGADPGGDPNHLLPPEIFPYLLQQGETILIEIVDDLRKGSAPGANPGNVERALLIVRYGLMSRQSLEFLLGKIPEDTSADGVAQSP